MPAYISVELRTLGGGSHTFRLSTAATCADLRWVAQWRLIVPRKRIIVCKGDDILEDTASLVEAVGWCVISDVIDTRVSLDEAL